jgi:hypothetical protein
MTKHFAFILDKYFSYALTQYTKLWVMKLWVGPRQDVVEISKIV